VFDLVLILLSYKYNHSDPANVVMLRASTAWLFVLLLFAL
jgi:hypothetical protein